MQIAHFLIAALGIFIICSSIWKCLMLNMMSIVVIVSKPPEHKCLLLHFYIFMCVYFYFLVSLFSFVVLGFSSISIFTEEKQESNSLYVYKLLLLFSGTKIWKITVNFCSNVLRLRSVITNNVLYLYLTKAQRGYRYYKYHRHPTVSSPPLKECAYWVENASRQDFLVLPCNKESLQVQIRQWKMFSSCISCPIVGDIYSHGETGAGSESVMIKSSLYPLTVSFKRQNLWELKSTPRLLFFQFGIFMFQLSGAAVVSANIEGLHWFKGLNKATF